MCFSAPPGVCGSMKTRRQSRATHATVFDAINTRLPLYIRRCVNFSSWQTTFWIPYSKVRHGRLYASGRPTVRVVVYRVFVPRKRACVPCTSIQHGHTHTIHVYIVHNKHRTTAVHYHRRRLEVDYVWVCHHRVEFYATSSIHRWKHRRRTGGGGSATNRPPCVLRYSTLAVSDMTSLTRTHTHTLTN